MSSVTTPFGSILNALALFGIGPSTRDVDVPRIVHRDPGRTDEIRYAIAGSVDDLGDRDAIGGSGEECDDHHERKRGQAAISSMNPVCHL
jgi:hypothetical protein